MRGVASPVGSWLFDRPPRGVLAEGEGAMAQLGIGASSSRLASCLLMAAAAGRSSSTWSPRAEGTLRERGVLPGSGDGGGFLAAPGDLESSADGMPPHFVPPSRRWWEAVAGMG